MSAIEFRHEWLAPLHGESVEISRTFARLSIVADGHVVTRVSDRRSSATRDAIYVPLYPLAEWIAVNWWHLLYESPSNDSQKSMGYANRHSVAAAGDGFAWPDLRVIPQGESALLEWRPRASPVENIEYVALPRSTRVDRAALGQTLADVVESVLARLGDDGAPTTFLGEEWSAIRAAGPAAAELCRDAARLGLDPFDLADNDADRIGAVRARLPEDVRDEALLASTIGTIEPVSGWIEKAMTELEQLPARTTRWRRPLSPPLNTEAPWKAGYEMARSARAEAGLTGRVKVDPWQLNGFSVRVVDSAPRPPATQIEGLASAVPALGPVCYTAKPRAQSRRFAGARALYYFLTSTTGRARLITGTDSMDQIVSRAFAAEFLAPADELKRLIPPGAVLDDDVEEIADSFGVSPMLVARQIRNHRLGELVGDRYAALSVA